MEINELTTKIAGNGEWKVVRIGGTRAKSYDEQYTLYKRTRTLQQVTNRQSSGEKEFNSSDNTQQMHSSHNVKSVAQNGTNQEFSNVQNEVKIDGVKSIYGNPIDYNDPTEYYDVSPITNAFDEFESLKSMRSDNDSIVISASVTYHSSVSSNPICYCFSVFYNLFVYEYCFVKNNFNDTNPISLCMFLGRILDDLCVERVRCEDALVYKYIPTLSERNGKPVVQVCDCLDGARQNGVYTFINNSATNVPYREDFVDTAGNKHRQYLRSYDNDKFKR